MTNALRSYRQRPEMFLFLLAFAQPLAFSAWRVLLNNFAVEQAAFTGREMGILQSLRELPGFLAFAVVFILLLVSEQTLALLALGLLAVGVTLTGFFPSFVGLCVTTLIMSTGFHYYETMQTSLTQQWIDRDRAAETFGRVIAISSFSGILAFALIWLSSNLFAIDYRWQYLIYGGLTLILTVAASLLFPRFPQKSLQHKKMILRKRYSLYYALVFMSGARRQIFTVFAGFLMVERFGYSVSDISLLFLVNASLNVVFARRIGRLIGRFGERNTLLLEYGGLVLVFCGYALVSSPGSAAVLYVIDHLFFAFAISIKTYFQKIAASEDISATAGVSFTINHIAAVGIPALFGLIWLKSPALVFWLGAGMAAVSLLLSLLIPRHPDRGNETCLSRTLRPTP